MIQNGFRWILLNLVTGLYVSVTLVTLVTATPPLSRNVRTR